MNETNEIRRTPQKEIPDGNAWPIRMRTICATARRRRWLADLVTRRPFFFDEFLDVGD